ncbi:uncharacterized protein LOC135341492 isoform X3 [Halichondria panicea]
MKRSSSAPNVAKLSQELKPVTIQTTNLRVMNKTGLSASNISLPGDSIRPPPELSPKRQLAHTHMQPLSSPLPLSRINSPTSKYRVAQIKKEEALDEREIEREVQEQIQLNKTLDDSMRLHTDEPGEAMEVLYLSSLPSHPPSAFVSPSSPLNRMRSRSLTPTSPGSSRTFSYRRSCSPVLRPSSLCIGKRKRDFDPEDMDTSPTAPCKKLQLGYASPFSLSPCVSPLMGNSPLHHSFSRKSSTTQESTPLSSPSSGIANPFALKYDNGSAPDHWQSLSGSGSACSSTGHSPSVGNTPINHSRITLLSMEDMPTARILSAHRFSNGTQEDYKNVGLLEPVDVITDTPTPLSPKGLQFRQKPFPLSVATLPSPIPRPASNNGTIDSSFNHIMGTSSSSSRWISPNTSPVMRSQPNSPTVIVEGDQSNVETDSNHKDLSHHSLQHDRHLSPFNTEIHGSFNPPRLIKTARRLHKSILSSSRQMIRPEPQRPPSVSSMDTYIGRSSSNPSVVLSSSSRLNNISSLCMSSSLESDQLQGRLSPYKSVGSSGSRTPVKRRMSDISTDSQDDGFMMESDEGSSFEESMPTTKTVRTIS